MQLILLALLFVAGEYIFCSYPYLYFKRAFFLSFNFKPNIEKTKGDTFQTCVPKIRYLNYV